MLAFLHMLEVKNPILGTPLRPNRVFSEFRSFINRGLQLEGIHGARDFVQGVHMNTVRFTEEEGRIFLFELWDTDDRPNFMFIDRDATVTLDLVERVATEATARLKRYGSQADEKHVRSFILNRHKNFLRMKRAAVSWAFPGRARLSCLRMLAYRCWS